MRYPNWGKPCIAIIICSFVFLYLSAAAYSADATEVTGRYISYNNSAFDTASDADAIAPDKTALLPGQTATFANYTSYSKGINGIIIDIDNLAASGNIDAGDFEFRVGNDNNPEGWPIAPSPASVTVSALDSNTHRITLIWDDAAINKTWLEIKVLANIDTGLTQIDTFYFGNAVAEAGNSTTDAHVDTIDLLLARNNPHDFLNPAGIDFNYDYNRDTKVDGIDVLLARNNQTGFFDALQLITIDTIIPTTYTITAVPGEGGVIQPVTAEVTEGESITFYVEPKRYIARADINGDGSIGIGDWGIFRVAFDTQPGDPNYNPAADINEDGAIDNHDFALLTLSFGLTPDDPAYRTVDVVIDGTESLGLVKSYTFTNVTAPHAITAAFELIPQTHTITTSPGTGGVIKPDTTEVTQGDSITFYIEPTRYNPAADLDGDGVIFLKDWGILRNAYGAKEGDPNYNPAADISGDKVINDHDAALLFASFDMQPGSPSYRIKDVVIDGAALETPVTSYTFTDVTEPHAITAAFELAPTVMYGDINKNAAIDIGDATLIMRHLYDGSFTLSVEQQDIADVNDSGGVELNDATLIMRFLYDTTYDSFPRGNQ